MASRAIHNVFRSPECCINVTKRHLNLVYAEQAAAAVVTAVAPEKIKVRARFNLGDIAFWMTHKENERLFAFISRAAGVTGAPAGASAAGDAAEFRCHVFESSTSAAQVGEILSEATKAAYEEYLASIKEKS